MFKQMSVLCNALRGFYFTSRRVSNIKVIWAQTETHEMHLLPGDVAQKDMKDAKNEQTPKPCVA